MINVTFLLFRYGPVQDEDGNYEGEANDLQQLLQSTQPVPSTYILGQVYDTMERYTHTEKDMRLLSCSIGGYYLSRNRNGINPDEDIDITAYINNPSATFGYMNETLGSPGTIFIKILLTHCQRRTPQPYRDPRYDFVRQSTPEYIEGVPSTPPLSRSSSLSSTYSQDSQDSIGSQISFDSQGSSPHSYNTRYQSRRGGKSRKSRKSKKFRKSRKSRRR